MAGIYDQYKKYGVENYYKQFSKQYKNPHEQQIREIYIKHISCFIDRNTKILDIACGEGLIAKLVNIHNNNYNIYGTDPFFNNSYCHYNYSFSDIALGRLTENYDMAICCYAYHLLEHSWQYSFLDSLAEIAKTFIIISPSKKIRINHPKWKITKEFRIDKICIIILDKA
jgi:2-polyprenyl-3-methyl-5-hydroxy-6-metoxy-1,4-benzoquinol methylase